ncbi:MAG: NAD(P)/FAD-dependent oxidoreductase [Candidatus Eremiobacterota bacterium]
MSEGYDAVVVGSGPNGLAAAITLARAGRSVLVIEGADQPGGAARTAELTLPGFLHDVGSSIHPTAVASPFFRQLPLRDHGLEWIHPDFPLAHPLDGGQAVIQERSVSRTAQRLGRDAPAWSRLFAPLVAGFDRIDRELTGPLTPFVRSPLRMLWMAWIGFRSAESLAGWFRDEPARALLAGHAAHSVLPLERSPSAAAGVFLATLAHRVGWPMPRGGAASITRALLGYLGSLGGELRTGQWVRDLRELPPSRLVLLDVTPRQFLAMAGDRLPPGYRARLERFRYGPGVFKVDYALDGPVPWSHPEVARAGTVHVGGTFAEVARSERSAWQGTGCHSPFLLCAQTSRFDPSRAPAGKHTLWAYCHVPPGFGGDLSEAVDRQIERFAPGFRDLVLARSVMGPARLEAGNPNLVGGDITGGAMTLDQLFTRPLAQRVPYATALPGVFLCSSSTPPGGGVHGMCGYHAARVALRQGN